jgi:hypothetical protein
MDNRAFGHSRASKRVSCKVTVGIQPQVHMFAGHDHLIVAPYFKTSCNYNYNAKLAVITISSVATPSVTAAVLDR